jgi:hypothetical protein
MSDTEGEFDFRDWIAANRVSEQGAKKLETNQINDLETLLLFRESDIELLKLSLADTLRFRAGINRLHTVSDVIPPLEGEDGKPLIKPPVVPSSPEEKVYSLSDVEKLLAGKAAVKAGGVPAVPKVKTVADNQTSLIAALSALLVKPVEEATPSQDLGSALVALLTGASGASSKTSDVRELMRDLLNSDGIALNSKGEKALLPINFLSCVRGTQSSDEVIHQGKDLNVVVQQASNKRVTPEKLSFGQWTGANARILDKLITSGRLSSAQTSDYLEYNRKIGDLLQLYTPSSVFLLDHNHRLEVHHNEKKRWCKIDATLQSSHLRLKDSKMADSGSASKFVGPSTPVGNSRRRQGRKGICWNYNSPDGCREGKDRCQYEHIEESSSARSSGVVERAPRFQKAATAKP